MYGGYFSPNGQQYIYMELMQCEGEKCADEKVIE
jgi:hypothetical protein